VSAALPTPAAGPALRDIHLPPAPSWWPPAPGWWLLVVLAGVLLFFVTRWLSRRQRARRWHRQIHAELERIAAMHATQAESAQLAAQVSQMLRRASRLVDPGAVALRDDAWLAFLDAQLPPVQSEQAPFRTGVGRALIDAPYRRAADPGMPMFDKRALLDLARSWLDAALPRRRNRV
jgi:HAMP domain-containing protein